MRILAVHGVATDAADPVGELWERELREAGVASVVTEARWPSTGGFAADSVALAGAQFRGAAVEAVTHAVQDFAAGGYGIVLAHSMGTVLALHVERLLRTGLPIICLASPLSNPAIWPALHAIGFGLKPREKVIHLWNDDDPIPGGKFAQQPDYFLDTRIAVANNDNDGGNEHNVALYLRHPHTHNALRLLWERGGGAR